MWSGSPWLPPWCSVNTLAIFIFHVPLLAASGITNYIHFCLGAKNIAWCPQRSFFIFFYFFILIIVPVQFSVFYSQGWYLNGKRIGKEQRRKVMENFQEGHWRGIVFMSALEVISVWGHWSGELYQQTLVDVRIAKVRSSNDSFCKIPLYLTPLILKPVLFRNSLIATLVKAQLYR